MNSRAWFRHCIAALISSLPVILITLPAQADDGKARYVAGAGRDEGDCLNKFRPCRSLDYAIARAGKSDVLQVAEGDYPIDTTQQLTQLLSLGTRVNAGFNRNTGFVDRNARDRTFLTGVPHDLRARFEQAGFTVIADTKGLFSSATERAEAKSKQSLAHTVLESEKSHAAAPCVGGVSNGFPCQSVSLLSHLSLSQLQPNSSSGADVWGFTDLNTGREYAIMGLSSGVAVVDITDPQAPEQVAYTVGSATTWREITTYQRYDAAAKRWRSYAYITADRVADRLLLLDLSGLPNTVERVNYSSDYAAAHTTYMVNADYTFGIPENETAAQLVISGASASGGNHRLYSLSDPRSPTFLGVANGGYAHDVASFAVGDARKSQCINAGAVPKCQVLADFNENTIDIWDVTNPSAARMLGTRSYSGASYSHSGWWTEDGRYLFAHDELDEQTFGLNTTVRVFDMADLAAPNLVRTWTGLTRAIDHNGYVRGNRYYFSNYTEGLTVLDITDPTTPTQIGKFDTYPASAQPGFVAAWGAYPFFASGTIIIGDINSGLYMLKNETLSSINGTLTITTPSVSAQEGQNVTVTVSRTGGGTGAVSVQLDLLHGSSDASDVTVGSQTLSWAAGDTQDKSLSIALNTDGATEDLELLLVRLKNPQGGATLNYPDTAHVRIAEAGATTRLRLLSSTVAVDDVRAKAFITVTRQGSVSGAASVNFATVPNANFTGFTAQQGTLNWADGDGAAKTITVVIDPTRLQSGQSGSFDVQLTATGNANLEADNGSVVATLTAAVNVTDSTPIAPPSSGGGGGGAFGLKWLVLLGVFVLLAYHARRTRAKRAGAQKNRG